MSTQIDQYISQGNVTEALSQCLREQQYHLGLLLARIYSSQHQTTEISRLLVQLTDAVEGITKDGKQIEVKEDIVDPSNPSLIEETEKVVIVEEPKTVVKSDKTRVMLLCNWCDSETLCKTWNKMSKGDYTWNNIQIVWEEPCDYYVVINCPPITIFPETSKIILFQMEPNMAIHPELWGEWSNPPKGMFKFYGTHDREYNNNEWHLSMTYNQLCSEEIVKSKDLDGIISTVLSDKYKDPGQVLRIDFAKYLDRKGFPLHVYGGNKFAWKQYQGPLPLYNKDSALLPYKYVFNAENHSIRNYYTEKLIDGILSECLVFYWGCPNIRDFLDSNAYVQLNLEDFEMSLATMQRAIAENWWEQRIEHIREAKKKILNDLQFFPRLERILAQ